MTARFCVNCGSPLIDGTCVHCATPAPDVGQASSQSPLPSPDQTAQQPQPQQQPPPPPQYGQPSFTQPTYGTTPYAPPGASRFPGSRFIGQWNWGAFFLTPFWLMNHGRVGLGIGALVLSVIPGLNFFSLIVAIWGGIKGNELAVTGRRFLDEAQYVAVQNAWRNWGFIIFALTIVLTVVAGILEGLAAIISQTVNH